MGDLLPFGIVEWTWQYSTGPAFLYRPSYQGGLPPAGVPEAYRAACRALDLRADPLLDEPYRTTGRAKETAWAFARDQVARGRQLIFPHHGLAAGAGGPPEAGG